MFLGGQTLSSLSSGWSTPALYSDHCIEEILKARTHANMGAARHSWAVRGGIEPGARGVLCHVGKHLEWRSMYNPFPHFSPGQPANNDLGASYILNAHAVSTFSGDQTRDRISRFILENGLLVPITILPGNVLAVAVRRPWSVGRIPTRGPPSLS